MDLLTKCAINYQALINYEYRFTFARKGNLHEIVLRFSEANFHHIAGLHKLKDISIARANRALVFQQILSNRILYDTLSKSRFLPEIKCRLNALPYLENLLDRELHIFQYNKRIYPYSAIESKFLFKMGNGTILTLSLLFLNQSENGIYFCRSFFPIDRIDYTNGQMRYTLLKKIKHNLKTGQDTVLYTKGNTQ